MRAAAILAAALLGCQSSIYQWGRYEDSVYNLTAADANLDLGAEIDSLEAQLEETVNDDRPVPPGLQAHLGWLQLAAGNLERARAHFESEKRLFPESTIFMDELLRRMNGVSP